MPKAWQMACRVGDVNHGAAGSLGVPTPPFALVPREATTFFND
jgi:hypothetical protein